MANMLSDSSHAYEFSVDDRFNKVYVHLDRYEFGNLIEDQSDVSELELVIDHEEPGEIWLHMSTKPPNEELMFILGTQNGKGAATWVYLEETNFDSETTSSSFKTHYGPLTISEQKQVLGYYIFTSGTHIEHLHADFDVTDPDDLELLSKYDFVYLISARFEEY